MPLRRLAARIAPARGGARWLLLPALLAVLGWALGSAPPEAHGQQATATATPVVRPGGRFEENDPALVYSGAWTTVTSSAASGGAFRRSTAEGASVQFTFPGPNIRWITTRGPDRGVARIFIDGQDRGTVDLYSAEERFQQEFSWGGLAGDQNHTIRIEVTNERSGSSTGNIVDVDAFVVAGAVLQEAIRFEDTDPAVRYFGTWTIVNDSRASGGGVLHRSTQGGAAAEFSFTGTSVTWLTSTGPNRGMARVIIDGVVRQNVDLYSAEERFQQAFPFEGLATGTHLIRVEVTGTRSGPSTDNVVDVDAFVVFGAATTPVPTPTMAATATPTPGATASPTASPSPTATVTVPPAPTAVRDARYFFETNYRIDHDPFWAFYNLRGGVDIFGFPVSRTFTFLGCTTQIFQRQLMQQCGAGAQVQTMNLLDPDLMPYNQINGSTFPPHDPAVAGAAPPPGTANYGQAVLEHVRSVAPETFEGLPVRFFTTFQSTVSQGVDGPVGDTGTPAAQPADPNLAALLNLQIWGFPTSRPMFDPNNRNFVYQRFQRGIMHFDATTGVTRGILLADYFKGLLVGQPGPILPPDLLAQAQGSRFLRQYCRGAAAWVCRPPELPATDLTFAFEPA